MDATRQKQHWSDEETSCFLALWSSSEVQSKLDGASRSKPVLQQIQRERWLKTIGTKKRTSVKAAMGALGDRPACQVTWALNSATIMLESMLDDSPQQSCTDHKLSAINDREDNAELPPPLGCSSGEASSEWVSAENNYLRCYDNTLTICIRFLLLLFYTGKRKRDGTSEILQYLERADERFQQHSKAMDNAFSQDMSADTQSLLGLIGRMVAVLEAQVKK
uniref:uncharacterized protein si:dkey-261j15.2 n=1 Tax=Gasterosteus aculeatus aculeatus TaxID=481459 RepID=UPI001A99E5E4|nr:uncharacterized protein si:dkey-261j15.2 [Gasterosteus aculeatus aculeatus]